MKKLPTGDKLYLATNAGDDMAEFQRRVIEAQRHARDSKLWIVALISSVASAFSALAAWLAICLR